MPRNDDFSQHRKADSRVGTGNAARKIAAICALLLTTPGIAETHSVNSGTNSVRLRLASYNIYGLPSPLVADRGQYAEIGRILARRRALGTAPHVIAIQEAWSGSGSSEILATESGYPHLARGAGRRTGKLLDSGMIILSEFPIESAKTRHYSECTSWDCHASKGALQVRVLIPDVPLPVEIYTTHLNSDPDTDPFAQRDECRSIRLQQISELGEWLARVETRGSPQFMLGDFNSTLESDELLWFFGHSQMRNTLAACLDVRTGCEGASLEERNRAIDHQFFKDGSTRGRPVRIYPLRYARTFDGEFRGAPLSDHLAVESEYKISW